MQFEATSEQVETVCASIREFGLEPLPLPGDRMAVGIPSAIPTDKRETLDAVLSSLPGVSKVTHVSRPYKLSSMEFRRQKTVVEVKGVPIGAGTFTVFAGPCSVESYEQLTAAAKAVKSAGAKVLRGGAFKPRTSPYAFQGLGVEGLRIMKRVGDEQGMVTISEAMSPDMVPVVADHVDILQIGARSMQNYPLLIAAGESGKPVFLKRGPSATIDEFLLAAEYVLNRGNPNVILCERGIVGHDRTYARNTLDLNAVPILKEFSHLPVVVDPSHGVGVARYVPAMTRAAIGAGADGVMLEVHPNPKEALSDASQTLTTEQFQRLMDEVRRFAVAWGMALA